MVRGRYEEAEKMCQQLMKALRKILGGEGIDFIRIDISESRTMGRGRENGIAGNGDEEAGTGRRASRHTEQHGQLGTKREV